MDTKFYQEFLVLAEQKNYVNAAARLFISQSVLTKHIQKMEGELGAKLFSRTTHCISLTEYGEILVPYARQILEKETALSQEILHAKNANGRHLTIGTITAVSPYGISDLLSSFRQKYPDITLDIEYGESEDLVKYVKERKVDLAFVRSRNSEGSRNIPPDSELVVRPFRTDHLAAVVPKNHPLAQYSELTFEQIIRENLMFLGKDKFPYRLVEQYAALAQVTPNVILNTSQAPMLIQFAGKGLGIAVMLEPVARFNATEDVVVIPLEKQYSLHLKTVFRTENLGKAVVKLLFDYIDWFRVQQGYEE